MKMLSEEELQQVLGGVKTGDYKDGKVYIKFPSIASGFSGYYGCDEIEKLCNDYYSLKAYITPSVTQDIKDAVKGLYQKNNRAIPSVVSEMLGIN